MFLIFLLNKDTYWRIQIHINTIFGEELFWSLQFCNTRKKNKFESALNSFHAPGFFLYPLKTSEKR